MKHAIPPSPRGWPILLALWVPFSVGLAIAIAQLTGGGARDAVGAGVVLGLLSFGLGLLVWTLTGVVAWPRRVGVGFFAFHLVVAVVYSVLWWGLSQMVLPMVAGRSPLTALVAWWRSDVLGWNLVLGSVVYAMAATVSYVTRLQAALRDERLAVARADAATQAARLSALEAKLNPHFLFNTLHSVAALVREHPQRAEDAIDTLGELLRDTLQERAVPSRSLEEEWRLTAQYLELERLRLGDRLTVVATMSSEALAAQVPPLMLQPLIENAIRHGIGPLTAGGTIRVTADVTHASLHLSVVDDGVGTDRIPTDSNPGLGLGVVRARVAAWRPPGRITITSRANAGFAVSVVLPESFP